MCGYVGRSVLLLHASIIPIARPHVIDQPSWFVMLGNTVRFPCFHGFRISQHYVVACDVFFFFLSYLLGAPISIDWKLFLFPNPQSSAIISLPAPLASSLPSFASSSASLALDCWRIAHAPPRIS